MAHKKPYGNMKKGGSAYKGSKAGSGYGGVTPYKVNTHKSGSGRKG